MKKVTSIKHRAINVVFLPKRVSYAAVVDSNDNEIEITDGMIVEACESMESDQVFPFAKIASR